MVRKVVEIIACIAVGYLLFNVHQNQHFKITRYNVSSEKLNNPFRAVLIADLHGVEYGRNNEELISAIQNENPDIILLAGDIVSKDMNDFSRTLNFLELIREIAPVFYGFGNHEYYLELNENFYSSYDIEKFATLLRYGVKDVEVNGNQIRIGSMAVDPDGYEKYGEKFFELFEDESKFFLLMSHYPWIIPYCKPDTTVDVVVSGHAHGGQFHLWGDVGVFVPGEGLFPKYTSGIHNIQGTTEIVTTGLGDHTIIPRLNNQPEMVVIDFLASR